MPLQPVAFRCSTDSYQLERIPQRAVDSLVGDDDGAALVANAAAGADTEEHRVADLRMVHEFDNLM